MTWIEKLKAGVVVGSPQEMQQFAMGFAEELGEYSVLCLHGDLGAGKTTFVGGLALAFQIKDLVTSPTYTLLNVHEGTKRLLHCDAYRLKKPEEIEFLGLEELMNQPYCWVIEWPERIAGYIPDHALHLYFEAQGDGARRILIV